MPDCLCHDIESLEVEYGGGQTLVKEQIVQRSDRLCYDTENLKKEYGGQWPNETANYILFKDEHSMLRNRHMIIFGQIYASSMNVRKSTESSLLTLTPSPGVGLQPYVYINLIVWAVIPVSRMVSRVGTGLGCRGGLQGGAGPWNGGRSWGWGGPGAGADPRARAEAGVRRTLGRNWTLGQGQTPGREWPPGQVQTPGRAGVPTPKFTPIYNDKQRLHVPKKANIVHQLGPEPLCQILGLDGPKSRRITSGRYLERPGSSICSTIIAFFSLYRNMCLFARK